ncbi:MAG: hypothetical protein A2X23_08625 [Chloroflexi bacterium GWC2_73_18]|nr:MAG: hypothetical protein A2X23_08625 [Chloroflexi bacterium GWC2_73_18]
MRSNDWSDPFGGAVRLSDAWSYRGFRALAFENARLRVTILPEHGAKVFQFVSKRAGRDLLYHHPRFDVRAPVFGANADDWWTGGIDEIAPTGHPCVVNGEQLPFLGEFWSQAWSWEIEEAGPERAIAHLWAGGVVTPLRIDRWMELRRDEAIVRSRHRLTNVGHEPFDFMWGIHPGLAARPGARLDVPAGEGLYAEGHPSVDAAPGTRYPWPHLPLRGGGRLDLSVARPPDPPSWELHFLDGLTGGWLSVTDPGSRSGFAMAFDRAVFPVSWLWSVYGGWRGIYAVALEAWTACPARLDRVIAEGRQRRLAPGETLETELLFIAHEGFRSVTGVEPDGRVIGKE